MFAIFATIIDRIKRLSQEYILLDALMGITQRLNNLSKIVVFTEENIILVKH